MPPVREVVVGGFRAQHGFDLVADVEQTFFEFANVVIVRIEGVFGSVEFAEPLLHGSEEFLALQRAPEGTVECQSREQTYLREHVVRSVLFLLFRRLGDLQVVGDVRCETERIELPFLRRVCCWRDWSFSFSSAYVSVWNLHLRWSSR